jgi:hypothetical protein
MLPDHAAHGRDLADLLLNRARPAEALEVVAKAIHLSPHDDELKRLQRRVLAAFQARPAWYRRHWAAAPASRQTGRRDARQ